VELSVKLLGDASKNVAVWVRGKVEPGDCKITEVLDLKSIGDDARGRRPRTVLLASALWTLQEKLGLYVWAAEERKPENLLLLMESRNFIRMDKEIVLEDWLGKLYIEPFNVPEPKWFWFQLDFDKVFER
jgi:hypothetical protein